MFGGHTLLPAAVQTTRRKREGGLKKDIFEGKYVAKGDRLLGAEEMAVGVNQSESRRPRGLIPHCPLSFMLDLQPEHGRLLQVSLPFPGSTVPLTL